MLTRTRRLPHWLAITLATAVALATSPACAAPPTTRDVNTLKPGMKGTGRTVFSGSKIESFDFEIVDILKTGGYNHDLILIRVFGPKIDAIGGIAYGMSGSPLYIDNDLIGAVAMTTKDTDAHFGYATPIGAMLKLWGPAPAPMGPTVPVARGVAGLPAGTPVLVSGLASKAFAPVARWFERRGLHAVQGPAAPIDPTAPADAKAELLPGSAISVGLTTGDVAVEATGTVTWRDGDRLLAFGHPFLRQGGVSYFLQKAYVAGVLPSQQMPMKVAFPMGDPVGAFTVDREAGVAGVIGKPAPKFVATIHVKDADMNRERTLSLEVVRDPQMAPVLVGSAVLQALDEVMDRTGPGTARISWRISAEGLPRDFSREDVVFSNADVQPDAVAEPLFGLDALLRNDFAAVTPQSVSIDVVVSGDRQTVRLTSVKLDPVKVKPGESVKVTCQLQPYRGQPFSRELLLTVPKTASPGRLVVDVHGRERAGSGPLSQAAMLAAGMAVPSSLADLLKSLDSAQRGDALWAEILTPEAAATRLQAAATLQALPSADPFGEETVAMPSLDLPTGAATTPLARAESRLDKVVLGRLRETLTVAAPAVAAP